MPVSGDLPPGSAGTPDHGPDEAEPQVRCPVCGASAAAPPPPTWSMSRTERGAAHVCPACTRRHVRSMEAQLEQEHW